ncbi:sulfur carrier protein ThiS [soil metagenome]
MTSSETALSIQINGEPQDVPAGLSIADLLRRLGRDPEVPGIAVALGGGVVPRAKWSDTLVEDGADVEIVTAIQGG